MKLILDENLSKNIADGFKCFGKDVEHILDYFNQGATDIEVLEFVGRNSYFLITKDKRIRHNKSEKHALHVNQVGAFFLVGKNIGGWQIIKALVMGWENIIRIAEEENKPFMYSVRASGKLKRIE